MTFRSVIWIVFSVIVWLEVKSKKWDSRLRLRLRLRWKILRFKISRWISLRGSQR
jgi:hypothetical protein